MKEWRPHPDRWTKIEFTPEVEAKMKDFTWIDPDLMSKPDRWPYPKPVYFDSRGWPIEIFMSRERQEAMESLAARDTIPVGKR